MKVLRPQHNMSLAWSMDGKPLMIGGCSKDKQAGYGRAAGCKAKGYKLHTIAGKQGEIAEWRVAPMNKDERVMGARMLNLTAARDIGNKPRADCDRLKSWRTQNLILGNNCFDSVKRSKDTSAI